MKKAIFIFLLLVLAVLGAFWYIANKNEAVAPIETSAPRWQTYTDQAQGYTFDYPPEFTYEKDAVNQNIANFVNYNVPQYTVPPFVYAQAVGTLQGKTLNEWWDGEVKAGNRAITSYQRVEKDRTVGGKAAIVVVPLDNGSTNYIFALGDKVMSVNAYGMESNIDRILQSFKAL